MRFTITLLLVFLTSICSGQDTLADDLYAGKFYGRIHSVKENSYVYSIKNGQGTKGKPKRSIRELSDFLIILDTLGRVTGRTLYSSSGAITSKLQFTYDLYGFTESITSFNPNGSVKDKVKIYNKVLDSTFLLERKVVNEKSKNNFILKYEYSVDSICTERLYRVGDSFGIITRKFNKSGQLILRNYWDKGYFKYRYEYTYNEEGQLIQQQRFNKSEKQELVYNWSYNMDGFPLKMTVTKNNVLKETWTYKYTFDDNNNWITCIEYENGMAKYIKERVIRYHEK